MSGEAAPFDGVLVPVSFFNDLVMAAEEGEALEAMERGWRNAIRLAEYRAERIAQLEAQASVKTWVTRICGASMAALGYLYGQERGRNQE